MKSLAVSVTTLTEDLVKKTIFAKFKKIVGSAKYPIIDPDNMTHTFRVGVLLALGTINPKSHAAEFEFVVTNGEKFDSHLQTNFKKLGIHKK